MKTILIVLVLILNVAQTQAQTPAESPNSIHPFVIRTHELKRELTSNTGLLVAAINQHAYWTDQLMNILSIRSGDIDSPGYKNSQEQAKIPLKYIEELLVRMKDLNEKHARLGIDFVNYANEPNDTLKMEDIRKEMIGLYDSHTMLIETTEKKVKLHLAVHDVIAKVTHVQRPDPSAFRRLEDLTNTMYIRQQDAQARAENINELLTHSLTPPPARLTLKDRVNECLKALSTALTGKE